MVRSCRGEYRRLLCTTVTVPVCRRSRILRFLARRRRSEVMALIKARSTELVISGE